MKVKLRQTIRIYAIRALARRLPACQQITPLISQAQDKDLSWRKRITMRLHLLTCAFCRRYAAQLELLRTLTHTRPGPAATETPLSKDEACLSPAARERLAEALRQANKPQ